MLLAEVSVESPLQKLLTLPVLPMPDESIPCEDSANGEDATAAAGDAPAAAAAGSGAGEGAVGVEGGSASSSTSLSAAAGAVVPSDESEPKPEMTTAASIVGAVAAGAGGAGPSREGVATGGEDNSCNATGADRETEAGEASAAAGVGGLEESEGYQALLQLLRAKTPAELLRASSRLCMHVSDDSRDTLAVAAGSTAPTPAGMTPGSRTLAELIRKDCNDLLLSNGREVDLSALLSPSPSSLTQGASKRPKLGANAFPTAVTEEASIVTAPPADVTSPMKSAAHSAPDTPGTASSSCGAQELPLARAATGGSHLRRPAGAALPDLEISHAPRAPCVSAGSSTGEPGRTPMDTDFADGEPSLGQE